MRPFAVQYKTEKPGVHYHETPFGFITFQSNPVTSTLCVLELYVQPKNRGEGHGFAMMAEIKDLAKREGFKNFMTMIDPNEDTAPSLRRIFDKLGLIQHKEPVQVSFELYSQEIS